MQKIKLSIGSDSFDEIRTKGSYYIDKSNLIYDLVANADNKITLFTRPRRFGKTLNMSMLDNFFDISRSTKNFLRG